MKEGDLMQRLRERLQRIDGKGYKAYKDLQGTYDFHNYRLYIDHVQGDPFASPSRIRIRLPRREIQLLDEWIRKSWRLTALEDWLIRRFSHHIDRLSQRVHGTGKSGLIAIDRPGQQILKRTAIVVKPEYVEVRLSIGLPARGRTVLGKEAEQMLCVDLPRLTRETFTFSERDQKAIKSRIQLADNQLAIRQEMKKNGWVAFVADQSVLPRESGISDRPLQSEKVVPFQSPLSMRVTIEVPHGDPISGMAIPQGVTLIVGGGYHGKSTLLKAIERGVYNHVEGDGREYVLTDQRAVKVRAEDGRRVEKVNISPFISMLPSGKDTRSFSTEDASGSTSQATNIMECLEMGASCLLMDEDTSATNFMIRDARMQALVTKGKEPITPFIDKVRQLFEEKRVSTILVLGGSGDYLDVADHVILMDHYIPSDVTQKAKQIAKQFQLERQSEGGQLFGDITERIPFPQSFDPSRGNKEKAEAKGRTSILLGKEMIDCSALEQLVDTSQTRAIALVMRWLKEQADGQKTLHQLLKELFDLVQKEGLDAISPYVGKHPGDLALPRIFEVAGAVNRLRSLRIKGEK